MTRSMGSGRGTRGRQLTAAEVDFWKRATREVQRLHPAMTVPAAKPPAPVPPSDPPPPPPAKVRGRVPPQRTQPVPAPARLQTPPPALDASWEKRIARGTLKPDFSLDLHGANLDQAWRRLMDGLGQARAMGARVVLVVTGKPRPAEAADRGSARGAIRAKIGDWLSASEFASDIVALRGAHRRHGGQGAIYVVLRRRR